ncbi:proton myo-inositol cotransporter-like [Haliotis cracherodii]|uniref:proton myo-inositol cotransporter-like n=1 Tax=Haliotis cracherodii TaxID=6455 RepID=UPI0039EC8D8E
MAIEGKLKSTDGHPWLVYISTIFASVLALLLGYTLGIISGAMLLLVDTFQLDTLWQQLMATFGTVGCALALLPAGYLVQLLGRKKMIIGSNTLTCIGAIVSAAAPTKEVVLVGRLLAGMGAGTISLVVPMYISECAPVDIRGRLGSLTQVLISIGVFLSSVGAGVFSGLGEAGWRWMFACPCALGVVLFVGSLFLPETPRWYMDRGREEEAVSVLKRLRNNPDEIQIELNDIRRTVAEGKRLKYDKEHGSSMIGRILTTPPVRRALLLSMVLAMITQVTGAAPVMYYTGTILKRGGFAVKDAIWMTAIPTALQAATAFVSTCLVERMGRKLLFLGSQIGLLISLVILGLGFFLSSTHSPVVSDDIQSTINNATTASMCNLRTCEQCIESSQCGFCYDVLSRASCVPVSVNGSATTGRCSSASSFNSSDFSLVTQACPSDYKWIPVIGSSLYLAVFSSGVGVIFVFISEVFPLWARGTCSSIATSVLWISQIVVTMTFLTLAEAITAHGIFWLYAGCTLLAAIFIFIFMPETRGLRLEEVNQLFLTRDEKIALGKAEVDRFSNS